MLDEYKAKIYTYTNIYILYVVYIHTHIHNQIKTHTDLPVFIQKSSLEFGKLGAVIFSALQCS